MAKLLQMVEEKKAFLIEQLLSRGVYKTSDQKHFYDVPLSILEREFEQIQNKEYSSTKNIVT
ncbi:Fur-regulated basic protein FbpA [Peribacillus sp. NPDC096379]|uniref:Fur-regulated basic protein FbpA n=1 Tax=Peribacillus sp. NPDC096379 TaxID=3364393 RepID=UPI0037FDD9D1